MFEWLKFQIFGTLDFGNFLTHTKYIKMAPNLWISLAFIRAFVIAKFKEKRISSY